MGSDQNKVVPTVNNMAFILTLIKSISTKEIIFN